MNPPIELQRDYWDAWNTAFRERKISDVSLHQKRWVLRWLDGLGRTDLNILEVGCGAGWLCPSLETFGRVTATDLSTEVLTRASVRVPDVRFIAGDFMALDLTEGGYDAVVSLEVLSHVGDHAAFVAKIARLLRPGGSLILATQNRPVLERYNTVAPTEPGQLRRWFDRGELAELLAPYFAVRELRTMTPMANKGPMRLVAGHQARRAMRLIAGRAVERALGAAGFGWTLMALAKKRG